MLLDPTRTTEYDLRTPCTVQTQRETGYLLLTGATGFLGQYLLRDLTLAGYRIAVLTRSTRKLSAQQRIELVMQRWEDQTQSELPRPVVLEGSIGQPDLGLSATDSKWVGSSVNAILHSAAIVKFDGELEREPWQTNVGGTQHLIDVAKRVGISNFHYVSTAYSCGFQNALVYEHDLERNQQFRNDYERSKFEAERRLRASGIPNVNVFRPSVIVGDSQTGFTSSYHGLYVYLRLMAMLIPTVERDENGIAHTKIRLPFTGNEQRNLVPVDWVSKVITRLISETNAQGRTFHLTPDQTISPRQIIDYCYKYFRSTGVEYLGSEGNTALQQSEFGVNFLQRTGMYHAYDTSDPVFDRSNLQRFAGDLKCPMIDEQMIHRFIRFGELDRWGKRQVIPPQCRIQISEQLTEIADGVARHIQHASHSGKFHNSRIGVNFIGSGGGQFTLHCNGKHIEFLPGLPASPGQLITTSTNRVLDRLDVYQGDWRAVVSDLLSGKLSAQTFEQVA